VGAISILSFLGVTELRIYSFYVWTTEYVIAILESPDHVHGWKMDTWFRLDSSLSQLTATASPVNHYKAASGSVEVLHLRRV